MQNINIRIDSLPRKSRMSLPSEARPTGFSKKVIP